MESLLHQKGNLRIYHLIDSRIHFHSKTLVGKARRHGVSLVVVDGARTSDISSTIGSTLFERLDLLSSTLLRIYRSGIRLVFDFFLIFFLFRFDLQIGSIVFFISVELCSSFCSICSLDVFLLRFIFFMNCIFSADVFLLMNCLLFMNCLSPLFLRMFFLRLVVLLLFLLRIYFPCLCLEGSFSHLRSFSLFQSFNSIQRLKDTCGNHGYMGNTNTNTP